MKKSLWRASLAACLALGALVSGAVADVKLPAVFGDQMVVQCDQPLAVWGWADPDEKVSVSAGGETAAATADSAGKWSVKLKAMKAGGPISIKVQGKNTIQLKDVLVGEVWLCSGQSNMAMTVNRVLDAETEIAAAKYPQIRLFTVARKTAEEPQADCQGQWKPCDPKTVAGFSAAGYFFGRELHKQLNVPVGLIDSSWGGTPVQAWTCLKAQSGVKDLAPVVENFRKAMANWDPDKAKENFEAQLARWKKGAAKAKQDGKQAPRRPQAPVDPKLSPNSPGRLYNGMIAPLAPLALRGAIWYQGESNAGNPSIYGLQMRTMIANWRAVFQAPKMAFLFVQLPNYMAAQQKPSEMGGWPLIREQFVRTLAVPNTGMAVTIDIGEAGDIHPRNKQGVGKRLAQWALAKTYGKDVVACGPLYRSMKVEGDKIVCSFEYAEGLRLGAPKAKGFAIAGADKKFVWAEAKVEGGKVIVWSPEVPAPAAVRYAWANNPECNLVNGAGLPASPFRTDDWKE